MKIHFTIEFDDVPAGRSPRVKVAPVSESSSEPPRTPAQPGMVKMAETPAPPLPPEPPADLRPAPSAKPGSGPQFNPEWMALVRDAKEPFTRRSLAVDSGLSVEDVTMRLNRMKHHGWIEQPCQGLWRRTKTFGQKPPPISAD